MIIYKIIWIYGVPSMMMVFFFYWNWVCGLGEIQIYILYSMINFFIQLG